MKTTNEKHRFRALTNLKCSCFQCLHNLRIMFRDFSHNIKCCLFRIIGISGIQCLDLCEKIGFFPFDDFLDAAFIQNFISEVI